MGSSRVERRRNLAIAVLAAFAAAGCATSSIASDVREVRALTRIERLPRVADTDVDPIPAAEAQRLLERPLDADTAVRIALANNRELRASLREMGIARGRWIQAGLLPNPTVEAELLPERNTELELRVEYDLTDAILAPMKSHAYAPDLDAARYRAAAEVIDIAYRVRAGFYTLQAAAQRLAIAQQVLDAAAASRDASTAMHDAGNATALDLAAQEAAYQRARIAVAELELSLAASREHMQRLLGLHGSQTAWRQTAGGLPRAPEHPELPDQLETRALRASLELNETQHRLEALARRAGVTRTAGWLPDVSVDVHALHGNPETDSSVEPGRDMSFGAGVRVGIPLFDRNQGTATALEAEFDALMERYYGMATDLRSAARVARSHVESAHARARQYQGVIVPAQRRVTEQTVLQYNAMQIGIFELLQARREELDVQLAYTETLREYWTAVAALDALLAGRHVTPDAPSASSMTHMTSDSSGGH